MRRTRAPNNVAVIPAMSDSETGGYYDDGPPATIWSKDDANIIQEELVALATLKGAALDTTGATRTQCATAVDAVLGMEAKGAETANVSTVWKHAVIASSTAEVGETADSVEHTLVAASSTSKAKGHQTAVIASTDAQAGLSAGTTEHAAVIATNFMSALGDASAVIACTGDTDPGVSGRSSAALASEGDGNLDISGDVCAAVASMNPLIDGSRSASIASTSAAISGTESAVVGGSGNEIGTSGVGAGTFACKNVKVNAAQAAAIAATCDTASDEVTGTNALIAATSDSKAAGAQAAVIGGSLNEANATGSVVIGSAYSKAVSGNNFVVILASRGYESDDPDGGGAGVAAPAYSVAGGYDAGTPPTPTGRSWAIESNGGNIYYDGSSSSPAADYAEMFENADGVAHAPGRLLARTGRRARLARPGECLLGAVSVTPTIVGRDDRVAWDGRYERDEWGARVMIEVVEGGERLMTPKVSADFDPSRPHVPRRERPNEWTCVGLLGQIHIAVDASVRADDDIVAGRGGVGKRARLWHRLRRIFGRRGAQVECMEIMSPYDEARGYAIALCMVR
jgi:hypothetical protein